MYNDISLCYWFKNRIVFVSSCLLDGKFLWAIISVYFLPYVFRWRFRYLLTTNLSKEVRWSLSWPMWWSNKWLSTLLKMSGPKCSLTILFFTFEGDSFIKGSWISLFSGDLRLRVWCCKWDGWVGNSVGTAPSFSNLPLFPGHTMKQDSLKCTLHIKLWSFGNQCSRLTALAHCFKTGGFLCGKWKKEIFPPFSCLFVQPYTTQVPSMLDSKPK